MIVLWLSAIAVYAAAAVRADPFCKIQPTAFSKLNDARHRLLMSDIAQDGGVVDQVLSGLRCGAEKVVADFDEEDSDIEEESDEAQEESLASSTMKKLDRKNVASVKKEVASKLAKSSKKKRSTSFTIFPYIVRASMNPFTFIVMVKSYWMSLFDLDYLKKREVSGQELRSALEEKAKRSHPAPSKGKRKMKPGQAKTLSDLPQLSS